MRKVPGFKLLFLSAVLWIIAATSAFAGATKVGELLDDESGDVFELFQEDDGSFFVWVHHADGTLSGFDIPSEGNPNPDDPDGVGGKPDIKELARRYHKGTLGKAEQVNNPLGLKRSGQGKGLAPRWNPPDTVGESDGTGGGSSTTPKDAAWIKDQARRGTGGEDDEDEGDTGGNQDRPGIGETGSVQPERVNPVPILKTPRSEARSMEAWQPPVEGGAGVQADSPVETPHQTVTPSVKASGGTGPGSTSGGGDTPAPTVQGKQGPAATPAVKVAPTVRVRPVRQ